MMTSSLLGVSALNVFPHSMHLNIMDWALV